MRNRIPIVLTALALAACSRETLEEWDDVGREADEAVDTTAEDVEENVREGAERIEPAVERAGEEIREGVGQAGEAIEGAGRRLSGEVREQRTREEAEEAAESQRERSPR